MKKHFSKFLDYCLFGVPILIRVLRERKRTIKLSLRQHNVHVILRVNELDRGEVYIVDKVNRKVYQLDNSVMKEVNYDKWNYSKYSRHI